MQLEIPEKQASEPHVNHRHTVTAPTWQSKSTGIAIWSPFDVAPEKSAYPEPQFPSHSPPPGISKATVVGVGFQSSRRLVPRAFQLKKRVSFRHREKRGAERVDREEEIFLISFQQQPSDMSQIDKHQASDKGRAPCEKNAQKKTEMLGDSSTFHPEESEKDKGDLGTAQEEKNEKDKEKEAGKLNRQRDDSLCLLLQRAGLTSTTLSELSKEKTSFGLAWLSAHLASKTSKKDAKGRKVPLDPESLIDLSGIGKIDAKKIFLFLDRLPPSVREIVLDPAVVKSGSLPLFLRFLERRRPELKKFTFANDSIGPEEAREVFPLLLPSVEGLWLKDTHLGTRGLRPLSDSIKLGHGSSLLSLKIENVGLNLVGLNRFCQTIQETPLLVETLSFSENKCLADNGVAVLVPMLTVESLPRLRALLLKSCGLRARELTVLADVLAQGHLPRVENFDLSGNVGSDAAGDFLTSFGRALRSDSGVCALKELNLFTERCAASACEVEYLLDSLVLKKGAPLENVQVLVQCLNVEKARELGRGKYKSIRNLRLNLGSHPELPSLLGAFVTELEKSRGEETGSAKFESLDLDFRCHGQGFVVVGDGIRSGSLSSFVRKMQMVGLRSDSTASEDESVTTGFVQLASSIAAPGVRLPILCELILKGVQSSGGEISALLGDAVRGGNVGGLRVLVVRAFSGDEFEGGGGKKESGEMGVIALMDAIRESDEGLPRLEKMALAFDGVGAGLGAVGTALMCRPLKMGHLSHLCLKGRGLTPEGLSGFADAVRAGVLRDVVRLRLPTENTWSACEKLKEPWGELMRAIAESDDGLPKLTHFGHDSKENVALALRKLPALEHLEPAFVDLSQEGVDSFAHAVLTGQVSGKVNPLSVRLLADFYPPAGPAAEPRGVRVDQLIRAIAENENGLPPCVVDMNLLGGRMSEEALASLAATGGGVRLSHLKDLKFYRCDLDDDKLRRLGEIFSAQVCPECIHLTVDESRTTLEGIAAFFGTLRPDTLPKIDAFQLGKPGYQRGRSRDFHLEKGQPGTTVRKDSGRVAASGPGRWAEFSAEVAREVKKMAAEGEKEHPRGDFMMRRRMHLNSRNTIFGPPWDGVSVSGDSWVDDDTDYDEDGAPSSSLPGSIE
uniref:Uncharacterized protein n=1 Tax=Chromera velia CCMP2878 TaxID=1169474 RepID=A0A0G4HII6_9ALVE|eukprot:Cvel_7013.t1-p1 / transcript=Cvel_7013.t1 / gene=Cvel_7013 / organism=Chromera_velia_CCMP2878 / gene_product=hypothetical protein / transcript_product=hypothetical protein / location=Cvel_scaffold357:37978-44526(-) / protein_length=1128 / sequence_SO=supercontig / SO=protein_coding / is_pseudo=false